MIYRLDPSQRKFLLLQPEYGMGYQLASNKEIVFLNAEIAVTTQFVTPTNANGLDVISEWFDVFANETAHIIREELLGRLKQYPEKPSILTHGSYSSSTLSQERFFRY